MADSKVYNSIENGATFLQLGNGELLNYLGCHDVGDLPNDKGSRESIQAYIDGEFKLLGKTLTAPDLGSTTLMTFLGPTAEWLEKINCEGNLFVNMRSCGKANIPTNFERQFVLRRFEVNKATYSNLVSRNESNPSEVEFESSFDPRLDIYYKIRAVQGSNVDVRAINDIILYSKECETSCPNTGKYGFAVTDFLSGSPASKANVLYTENYGATFTAVAGNPFAAAEDIMSVVVVFVGADAERVIVVRGTTDAGNPAEVAYSDDLGVTWNNVNVGDTNGQYASGWNSMVALDLNHIWLALSDGGIFFSSNGGITWTDQSIASVTEDLNAISFMNSKYGVAAGNANTILTTTNGGSTWGVVTGPTAQAAENILSVAMYDEKTILVGYDNGKIYITTDGGINWTDQTFVGSGTGAVNDLTVYRYTVYMVHNDASPEGTVFRSSDCGANWDALSTVSNDGVNAVAIVNENSAVAVGEVTGGVGFVAVAS